MSKNFKQKKFGSSMAQNDKTTEALSENISPDSDDFQRLSFTSDEITLKGKLVGTKKYYDEAALIFDTSRRLI